MLKTAIPHTSPSPLAPATQAALAMRLRRLALGVRALVLAGGAVTLALPLVFLLAPDDTMRPLMGDALMNLRHGELTAAARWSLLASQAPVLALVVAVLWQLWRLFGCYRQGQVFSATALHHLQRFGWGMVLLAVAEPLSRTAASVVLTLDNPPGQRMLVVTLGSHDYTLGLLALVFVAIARVMAEAARAAEENAQFV